LQGFINDEYFLVTASEQFADFVLTLEDKSAMVTYREMLGRKSLIDFGLKLDTRCDVCQILLMGTEFIKFGCGYFVHRS
jgi:hypothetical protein